MSSGKNALDLLEAFRNKGAAWQSQDKADRIAAKLKTILKPEEWNELSIAHNHYQIGEGAAEFYDVVNKLIKIYKEKF